MHFYPLYRVTTIRTAYMISTSSSAPSKRFIKPACFAICAAFLVLASRGLLSGYSYWFDEIYSVSASLDTWQQLYQKWILQSDVHPPLYHIFLKLWMLLLGSSETATRFLSFVFSLVALSAFSFDAIAGKRWRRVTALLFIGSSPLFAYYAQETRSYSLVLALSSIVTLSILDIRSKDKDIGSSGRNIISLFYYIGAFLLSITHYFGWIYVFAISIVLFFENRIKHARPRALFVIAAISVWPIWHVVVGNLGGKSGGDFWITISPPVIGTIKTFLNGCLPFLAGNGSTYLFVVWGLITALILVSARSWISITSFIMKGYLEIGAIAYETRFALLSTALVVGLLSLVDLHTPMSTTRNYIVLLPPVMIALASSLTMLVNIGGLKSSSGAASSLLVVLIILLLVQQSWNGLTPKTQAHQNWKSLSEYVKDSKICTDGCFAINSYGLHDFYFLESGSINDLSISKGAMGTPASTTTLDEQVDYVKPRQDAKILGFHGASGKISDLIGASKDRVCIQPSQSWENSTFLILPKSLLTGSEEKYGMKKCAIPE